MKHIIQKIKELVHLIEWPNFLFIVLSPVVAIVGTIWVFQHGGPHWATWILAALMMLTTGLGITAGYHRLFSHRSYQASWIVRLILLLFGGASFQGSAREWCCAHRKHHRFVDREGDPYNIKKGFWYAHVGWVVLKADQSDESNIKDLKKDPLILFQDRFYIPLTVLVSLVLPTALAAMWGDAWGGLFIAGFARIVVNHHLTFLINSYAHYFGKQNYSDQNTSRDSWLLSFFTYGEGYHNFHHAFESDFRNGIRPYHFDPGKWLIQSLSWLGLASRLKSARYQRILAAKLRMDEKRLRERLPRRVAFYEERYQFLTKARQNIEQIHLRLIELKTKYQQLKREKTESVLEKLELIRGEMAEVKRELKQAMAYWQLLISGKLVAMASAG